VRYRASDDSAEPNGFAVVSAEQPQAPLLVNDASGEPMPWSRRTHPVPPPPGHTSRYLDHLPLIFQDGDFLGRFLLIFESIWEPLEQRTDHVAFYVDPRTCPDSFLRWPATWVDGATMAGWPEARLRAALLEAVELYGLRGTRYALVRWIQICTGLTPVVVEADDHPFVVHIRLEVPAGQVVDAALVETLVTTHKPAHVGYVLDIQDGSAEPLVGR
jgi:phage tail-like protein